MITKQNDTSSGGMSGWEDARRRATRAGSALLLIVLFALGLVPGAGVKAAGPIVPRILASMTTAQREVALTFDDGPSLYTPQVLAVLHRFGAQATFFLIGREIGQYPATVRAEVAAGDEIGNHTYTHANLLGLPNSLVLAELAETQAAARQAGGVTPTWFRPPFGDVDERVAELAASLGLRTITWSVDPRDWTRPGVSFIVARVLADVRPGSVIVMHDGGGDRSETVIALSIILPALRERGYQFVTLDALFSSSPPHPCDLAGGARWFSSEGIARYPTHRIYRAWQDMFCSGTNLGPATSPEYRLSPTVIAQDFAGTAHRLEWDTKTGTVHVTIIWSWAIRVFTERGVSPLWHTPITQAWFDQYFHGYDWGPALEPLHRAKGYSYQHFANGYAFDEGGRVLWRK
jgi:peptidoglycan/xylan/chitin deacetylase (PgdA/CDA1 family)